MTELFPNLGLNSLENYCNFDYHWTMILLEYISWKNSWLVKNSSVSVTSKKESVNWYMTWYFFGCVVSCVMTFSASPNKSPLNSCSCFLSGTNPPCQLAFMKGEKNTTTTRQVKKCSKHKSLGIVYSLTIIFIAGSSSPNQRQEVHVPRKVSIFNLMITA